jgi:hypothetical protein
VSGIFFSIAQNTARCHDLPLLFGYNPHRSKLTQVFIFREQRFQQELAWVGAAIQTQQRLLQ